MDALQYALNDTVEKVRSVMVATVEWATACTKELTEIIADKVMTTLRSAAKKTTEFLYSGPVMDLLSQLGTRGKEAIVGLKDVIMSSVRKHVPDWNLKGRTKAVSWYNRTGVTYGISQTNLCVGTTVAMVALSCIVGYFWTKKRHSLKSRCNKNNDEVSFKT